MRQAVWSKVLYVGLVFLAVFLPFYGVGFPMWIGASLCGLGGLMLYIQGNRIRPPYAVALLITNIYLVEVLWLVGSHNLINGLQNVLLKISLFLISGSLLLVDHGVKRKKLRAILGILIGSTAVSAAFRLIMAIKKSMEEQVWNVTYDHLSIWVHPGYYGILIGAVIILAFWSLHQKKEEALLPKWLMIAVLTFLCTILVLLSARMQIIAMLFLGVVYGLGRLGTNFNLRSVAFATTVLILLIASGIGLYQHNIRMQYMFSEYTNAIIEPGERLNSIETRMVVWSLGLETALESPFLGHGTANTKKLIQAKAAQVGHEQIIQKDMGVHNQYLDAWITNGIIGLLLMLALILHPILRAFKNRNFLLAALAVFFGLSLITESVFQREMGILTFGLIVPVSILLHQIKDDARC